MAISEEDITITTRAKAKIAILEAKRQDIIKKAENDIQKKRDAISQTESQKVADLSGIDAKIQVEKENIVALIANV